MLWKFPGDGLTCDQLLADRATYRWRHLIESFFGKLKDCRRVAMRNCKTHESFNAFVALAATVIRLR
jgi:transposase